jgi:hypothetical protein
MLFEQLWKYLCILWLYLWRLSCKRPHITIRLMVFNATFNNISVISWRSVLLVEETGVPVEYLTSQRKRLFLFNFSLFIWMTRRGILFLCFHFFKNRLLSRVVLFQLQLRIVTLYLFNCAAMFCISEAITFIFIGLLVISVFRSFRFCRDVWVRVVVVSYIDDHCY